MANETKVKKEVLEFEKEEKEIFHPDLMDEDALGEIMPTMDEQPLLVPPEEKSIIEDDVILNLYQELLNQGRDDRKQVDELLVNFVDMVINDGDATSSSKEALVNLVKVKSDITDKMAKVADLMTRIKLKEKDTFPRYLAHHQHSNVTIETNSNKRDILKALEVAKKKRG